MKVTGADGEEVGEGEDGEEDEGDGEFEDFETATTNEAEENRRVRGGSGEEEEGEYTKLPSTNRRAKVKARGVSASGNARKSSKK
ncbi:hypothetical protein LTR17_027024, partial [Elasticomyces elasticus]